MTLSIPLLHKRELLRASIVLLFLTIITSAPLYSSSWFFTHEGIDPLQRVFSLGYEIENGQWYPRWLSASYGGKGSPFANFYSPGLYFAAAYLCVFGLPISTALKLLCTLVFFSGALGMFFWTRLHYSTYGALLAAILYLFAPYHFLDIYVRGALAEFCALAFLPYLFLGIDLMFKSSLRSGILVTSLTTFALIIVHVLSALMISIFAFVYFCFMAYRSKKNVSRLLIAATAPVMGIGLSAFYWLPVIFETKYLSQWKQSLTSGCYSYSNHFVYIDQLFSTFWGNGGSVPGPNDRMSFQIGVTILLFSCLSFIAIFFVDKATRSFGVLLLSMGMIAVVCTMSVFSILYRQFDFLSFLQFPWRFLGTATFFLAAFGGLSAELSQSIHSLRFLQPGLVVLGILMCLGFSTKQRTVTALDAPDVYLSSPLKREILQNREIGPLCMEDEYLPKWVTPYGKNMALHEPSMPYSTVAHFSDVVTEASKMSFTAVSTSENSMVTIPWFYFPGWEITIDGVASHPTADENGFLSFTLPAGRHSIAIRFGSTVPRVLGWIVSIGSMCTLSMTVISLRSDKPLRPAAP